MGQKILAALADGPRRYTEIADEIGLGESTMPRLLRLMRYGLVERVSRGVYRSSA